MSASVAEQDTFEQLKAKMDAYAKAHGFGDKVQTVIERRGLVVRVLTDNLLFALRLGHAPARRRPAARRGRPAAQP